MKVYEINLAEHTCLLLQMGVFFATINIYLRKGE